VQTWWFPLLFLYVAFIGLFFLTSMHFWCNFFDNNNCYKIKTCCLFSHLTDKVSNFRQLRSSQQMLVIIPILWFHSKPIKIIPLSHPDFIAKREKVLYFLLQEKQLKILYLKRTSLRIKVSLKILILRHRTKK